MIVLHLDYPISTNDMWKSFVPKGWKRPTFYLTPEAKAWKKAAAWTAKAAGVREPIRYSIALHVVHHHREIVQDGKRKGQRNGHVFDIDNVLKVALDSLKGVVYVDDRQIKRILAEYGEPTPKGGLTIEIEDFGEPFTPGLGLLTDLRLSAPGVATDEVPW